VYNETYLNAAPKGDSSCAFERAALRHPLRARFAFIREFNYNEPPSGEKRKKISVPFEVTSRLIDAFSGFFIIFSPDTILPTKIVPRR